MVKVMLLGRVLSEANVPAHEEVSVLLQGLREFKQDARTEQVYGFSGEWSGALVCNVNSSQELAEYIALNPMSKIVDWEVHNAVTLDEIISTLEKFEKHWQAQQKAA